MNLHEFASVADGEIFVEIKGRAKEETRVAEVIAEAVVATRDKADAQL